MILCVHCFVFQNALSRRDLELLTEDDLSIQHRIVDLYDQPL